MNIKGQMKLRTIIILLLLIVATVTTAIIGGSFSTLGSGTSKTYFSPDFVQLDCTVVNQDVSETFGDIKPGNEGYPKISTFVGANEYQAIPCDDFTKTCSYSMTVDTFSSGICGAGFEAFVCNENDQNCNEITLSNDVLSGTRNAPINLGTYVPGQTVYVRAANFGGFLCANNNKLPIGTIEVTKTFDQYGLVQQGDARLIKTTGSCVIPNNVRRNVVIDEDGDLSSDAYVYENKQVPTALTFQQIGEGLSYITYVNEFNPVSQDSVYSYQGKEVYCSGIGDLYEFGEFTTQDGNTRALAPTTFLKTVDCCPYQQGCTAEFNWEPESEEGQTCTSDLQCLAASNYYFTGAKEVSKQACVSGVCEIVETIDVECASDADCPGGFCAASIRSDASTWVCKEEAIPTSGCGDDFCSSLENQLTCPQDCGFQVTEEESTFSWPLFLTTVTLGLIGGILVYVYSAPLGKTKNLKITRAVIAVVVSLLIMYLVTILFQAIIASFSYSW